MTLTFGSLFSGVGGFDLGFERAGMVCSWQCEIDAAAASVLSQHWPDVPKHTDVRTIGAHNLEPVDVICGGFPCQDLSVAGNRAGLAGSRSGLFFEVIRIVCEMREATDGLFPNYLVLENVPGLLSSNGGRDFAMVLGELAQLGALDIAWRILDAQFFGVAQRRRRVFLIADFRGERAGQILFESESLPGHPAPRRASRQDIAGTLGGSSQSGGFRTTDLDNNGAFIPLVSRSLTTREGARLDSETCTFVLQHAQIGRKDDAGAQGKGWQEDVAFTLDSRPTADVVAHSVALRGRDGGATAELGGEVATALRASQGGGDKPHVLVATFDERNVTSKANRTQHEYGLPANTLHADALSVITPMAVRRLTPTECERLMGLPDGWTKYRADGSEQADSSRYRQLGNAVVASVSEWIAKRIVEAAQ